VSGSGFATKKEAADAEVARQIEEQQKRDLAKAGASVVAAPPKTLSMLLTEFISQHAEEKLAPKTIERYRDSPGDHATAPQPRMERDAEERWPYAGQDAASDECEDGPKHRRCGLQRVWTRDKVGIDNEEPSI
jgi:hypothetical protein